MPVRVILILILAVMGLLGDVEPGLLGDVISLEVDPGLDRFEDVAGLSWVMVLPTGGVLDWTPVPGRDGLVMIILGRAVGAVMGLTRVLGVFSAEPRKHWIVSKTSPL